METLDEEIKSLWDKVLESIFERLKYKTLTVNELRHLKDELLFLSYASKGKRSWPSVIDVFFELIKEDISVKKLLGRLNYSESQIYRALKRLEAAGIAEQKPKEGLEKFWTINKFKCPVLYRATRE
ncbi:MAG: hypothetical protein QW193_01135 [Nitrososphaerales archaeon]